MRNAFQHHASPEDFIFLDEIRSGLARGENDLHALNYRAAAMLYFRPHELEPWEPARIPPWLVEDFILWSIHAPGLFYDLEEKDEYFRRIHAFLLFMRDQIAGTQDRSLKVRLAETAVLRLNLIPAYFARENVRLGGRKARQDVVGHLLDEWIVVEAIAPVGRAGVEDGARAAREAADDGAPVGDLRFVLR